MDSAESAPVDFYTYVQSAEGPTPCINVPRKEQNPPLPSHNQSLPTINDPIMCTQPNFDIVTPVCFKTFEILLKGYNHRKAHRLVQGFKNGFELGYEDPRQARLSNNLQSAVQHPEIVEK